MERSAIEPTMLKQARLSDLMIINAPNILSFTYSLILARYYGYSRYYMKYKKRIHIAPVGFEVDRIVMPAIENKADKVYLLVHDKKTEDKAGPYIERVIKQLKANKSCCPMEFITPISS